MYIFERSGTKLLLLLPQISETRIFQTVSTMKLKKKKSENKPAGL